MYVDGKQKQTKQNKTKTISQCNGRLFSEKKTNYQSLKIIATITKQNKRKSNI